MRLSSTALSLLLASCKTSAFGSLSKKTHRTTRLTFTRNFGVGLLQGTMKNQCMDSNTYLKNKNMFLSTRGGSSSSTATVALNSAVSEEATTEPAAPVEYFRSDYEALPHIVSKINMDFNICDGKTTVTSEMNVEPNPTSSSNDGDLVLDGDETAVKLLSLQMNGKDLVDGVDYEIKPGKLIIKASSLYSEGMEKGMLTTVVEIVPEENTQLSGLYKSGPMYCTQCEAMGFRRITYYP